MTNLDYYDDQYFPETMPTGADKDDPAMWADTGFYSQPADAVSRPAWDPEKNPTTQLWI